MSNGGLSKVRLDRMHEVMSSYVDRGEVAGLVTLVSRCGETHVDANWNAAGHDLPYLIDDQADHSGRGDDSGGRMQAAVG
jgi:hypothetical protein